MGPSESRNLWISLGAGIFATFMLYSYTQEQKAQTDKAIGEKVRVLVAKEDIRDMDTIYDNVVEVVEKSKADVEPDAFRDVGDIVGTVAAIPIKKGQTLTKNKVLEPGPETGMAIQVSPNKRAVTVPVSPERVNAGLIRPGDRVDIFAVVDSGKGATQKREVILFRQDVLILATGVNVNNNLPRTIEKDPNGRGLVQTTLTGDTKYPSITIEVDINDAQDMIFLISSNPSSLYFLLRNPHDRKPVVMRNVASSAETILLSKTSGPNAAASYGSTSGQSSGFSGQPQSNSSSGTKPGN
jgi:pilus assembly protein CpaB